MNRSAVTDYGMYEQATTDHEHIRRWVDDLGGTPSAVPLDAAEDPGLLRFEFSDDDDGPFESLDWETFFERFEADELALLYRTPDEDEDPSQCYELTDRVLVGEY